MTSLVLPIPLRHPDIAAFQAAVQGANLVVVPTDTVYGIGADPKQAVAIDRLLTAKGRGRDYPSPVLATDYQQVQQLVSDIPEVAADLAAEFWPGALTMVLPADPKLGWDLGITQGTVAVRVPAHKQLQELLAKSGPLAVTSANLHGEPAATNCEQARKYFGDRVQVYVDGGQLPGSGVASTIIKPLQEDSARPATRPSSVKQTLPTSNSQPQELSSPGGPDTGKAVLESDTITFKDRTGLRWQVLRSGAIAWQDLAKVAGS